VYRIYYYVDRNGRQPVKEYIDAMKSGASKDCRIRITKIRTYMNILSMYGIGAGEPYIKNINAELWELRPLRDRFFFAGYDGDKFVIVHHYMKKTRKTPRAEIVKALANYHDFLERVTADEE